MGFVCYERPQDAMDALFHHACCSCRSILSAVAYGVPDCPIVCLQVEHELRVAQADLVTMLR